MGGFRTVHYEIKSQKIPRGEHLTLALLCDLHGHDYGEGVLAEAIRREGTDLVLCGGDMILRVDPASYGVALSVLGDLAGDLPVYQCLGNHEQMLEEGRIKGKKGRQMLKGYAPYARALAEAGVITLRNQSRDIVVKGIPLRITGLSLPLEHYRKPFPPAFRLYDMESLVGKGPGEEEPLRLLLAHNPYFGQVYLDWGAFVTLSGHYHGGVWRLGRNLILASPYFHPFPRFGVGDFHREGRHLFVSPGLGEHSVPFRIHNPRELMILTVRGE